MERKPGIVGVVNDISNRIADRMYELARKISDYDNRSARQRSLSDALNREYDCFLTAPAIIMFGTLEVFARLTTAITGGRKPIAK
jgi:hypothetical protein